MTEATTPQEPPAPDWEAFYKSYRKPGYVPGYEILTRLGAGMFGLVYKARKESIGKDYAIKFLKVDDDTVSRAVLQELESVRLFAQLDHPNLVAIEDRGVVDGIPFLVMAYAGSETLRDRLAAPDGDRQEMLRCALQACRGVAALHQHGLVHFDLKPANVFLKGGVARVGDYGLSKLMAQSRNTLSMGRGTPYYMAPELLRHKGDARSDIYSLGVILYECATGDVPFRGDNEWEVLRKHEREAPVFPAGLDERLRAVLERCLAKDPSQRFARVEDLLAALGVPAGVGAAVAADEVAPRLRTPAPPRPPELPRASPRAKEVGEAARAVASGAKVLANAAVAAASEAANEAVARARRGWHERGRTRRRGRSGLVGGLALLLLLGFCVSVLLPTQGVQRARAQSYAAAARLQAELERFRQQVPQLVRASGRGERIQQRSYRLASHERDLAEQQVERWVEEVEPDAVALAIVRAMPWPTVVVALERLQQCDPDSTGGRRCVERIHELLGQVLHTGDFGLTSDDLGWRAVPLVWQTFARQVLQASESGLTEYLEAVAGG